MFKYKLYKQPKFKALLKTNIVELQSLIKNVT